MNTRITNAALALVMLLTLANTARADFMFSEDFTGPGLNPNLEFTNGFGGYEINGTIGNLSFSEREYVRTVDSDYRNFNFELTLTHDFFVANDIAFVGVGSGLPDSTFSNEPGFGSFMFRLHNPSLAGGRIDLAYWESGEDFTEVGLGNITNTNEDARVSIVRRGDNLTFGLDTDFSGTYTPDIVRTFDLSDPGNAAIKASLDSESRLFFGSTFGTRFDDLLIASSIPEPGLGLFALMIPAALYRRRREREHPEYN